MKYQVAVPSYKRYELCRDKTLPMLRRHGVPVENTTVFVANDAELAEYRKVLPAEYRLVVGVPGIARQRRFMGNHYAAGTKFVMVDDDVSGLMEKDGPGLKPWEGRLETIFDIAFDACDKVGARHWGINPVANGMFMADELSVGLRYICAIFCGAYAHDPLFKELRSLESSGEDFLSTILSFKRHGSVVRIEWLCPKTQYFADGGIKAELAGKGIIRDDDHARNLVLMAQEHPDIATTYTKAGGVVNIRLKRMPKQAVPKAQLKKQYNF